MASKRMFSLYVINTDAFLEMPCSTQALYFHLCMRADDDGFLGSPKVVMRTVGASEDDLKLLIAKRFVLVFEDGVIVIKHWRMHNTLSRGRYTETNYLEEKAMLKLKDNNAYTFGDGHEIDDSQLIESGKRQTNKRRVLDEQKTNDRRVLDEQKTLQKRKEKKRIEEKSIEENSKEKDTGKNKFSPPTLEEVQAYCIERGNNVNPETFINFYESKGWMIGKNKMKNWKACIHTWEQKEQKPKKKTDEDVMREWLEEYGGEE